MANVLGIELIGRFGEVPSKLGDDMQVNPDGGRRVMTDLQIFQHPLSKWGRSTGRPSFHADGSGFGGRTNVSADWEPMPFGPDTCRKRTLIALRAFSTLYMHRRGHK